MSEISGSKQHESYLDSVRRRFANNRKSITEHWENHRRLKTAHVIASIAFLALTAVATYFLWRAHGKGAWNIVFLCMVVGGLIWSLLAWVAYPKNFIFQSTIGLLGLWLMRMSASPIFRNEYVKEIGFALLVAAIVSAIYDVGYHKQKFEEPLSQLKRMVGEPEQNETTSENEGDPSLFTVVSRLDDTVMRLQTAVGTPTIPQSVLVNAEAIPVQTDPINAPIQLTENDVQSNNESGSLYQVVTELSHIVTDKLRADLGKTGERVVQLISEVERLTDIMGYAEFRNAVQNAYGSAETRILSVANNWSIDDDWWREKEHEPTKWTTCTLFKKLSESKLLGQPKADPVIFVGKMPWPGYSTSVIDGRSERLEEAITSIDALALNNTSNSASANALTKITIDLFPDDFQRLLGIAWRLVVARKVRTEKGLSKTDSIRVNIASVPITATIVDDKVFMLLYNENDPNKSRGTQLTGRNSDKIPDTLEASIHQLREKEIADTYYDLIWRYLRHARSGREYLYSVLCMAELGSNRLDKQQRVLNSLPICLDILGINRWLDKEIRSGNREFLREQATDIFREFLKEYPIYDGEGKRVNDAELTFRHIRGELV